MLGRSRTSNLSISLRNRAVMHGRVTTIEAVVVLDSPRREGEVEGVVVAAIAEVEAVGKASVVEEGVEAEVVKEAAVVDAAATEALMRMWAQGMAVGAWSISSCRCS